ncbi:unnamed protein product [Thelazia callipaeda]|uniref:FA_desaturase domain-containing protein n=1 Tax=Thelazia callipaeda TaxID=103827 RepID=A0A0N5CZL6_THECL|nr:unnamed protein product [Thelazia callipaeda]
MKINGKWLRIDEEMLSKHPGGIAITAYRDADSTTAFHVFHAGSKVAYQWLEKMSINSVDYEPSKEQKDTSKMTSMVSNEVIGSLNLDAEHVIAINQNFNRFRAQVRNLGLFEAKNTFFIRKICEAIGLLLLAVLLQVHQRFILSALVLGLAWQQLGWLIHEYAHNQHFKNHYWNNLVSYVVGNLLQGFSSGGWKEQHNMHHATTNVIGRDGDINLMPFWAVIPSDLLELQNSWVLKMIPYQHIYWTLCFPFLRLSWLIQSISFVINMSSSPFEVHRKNATIERLTLFIHWCLVLLQLYFLPTLQIRFTYFLISQLFAGFLLAHVVTYNHYSTSKFQYDDPILKCYACLQLHTTRNMRPGIFTDWLWGGLNYQIEHHLFPNMPRHNLKKVMPLVKEFCKENKLPYMVNGYFEGWWMEIRQMAIIAKQAQQYLTRKLCIRVICRAPLTTDKIKKGISNESMDKFTKMNQKSSDMRLKIDGKWLLLTKDFQQRHPGGSVITQYRNADATQIFHAFHEGSKIAYKQLDLLKKRNCIDTLEEINDNIDGNNCADEINVSSYNLPKTKEKQILDNFATLREEIIFERLFDANPLYYVYKSFEAFGLLLFAFILQYYTWYTTSAMVLALCWQQFGWLTHDFCHQQPSKNRKKNDFLSLIYGNIVQGFSRSWWKEKHNTHHAVTNIVRQDGDIDLAPLLAFVRDDLKKYHFLKRIISKVIRYQHLYFTIMLPFLRFSWTIQSVAFVLCAPQNQYKQHVINAFAEQLGIALHWSWVIFQLWLLPTAALRILYFIISQLGAGLLIAHVVTYSHNSVAKFPYQSRLLNNFPCLHILTTRNMRPSPIIDWFWGGLNYQIEHHLFPTVPRANLYQVSLKVKKFCDVNGLPYLVDDYMTGYKLILHQLKSMADSVSKITCT